MKRMLTYTTVVAGMIFFFSCSNEDIPNINNLGWTRLLGSAGGETICYGLALDRSGSIYLTGKTSTSLNGETLTGTEDLFLIKLSSSGKVLWTKLIGAAGVKTNGVDVNLDPSGFIYVSGLTYGSIRGQSLTGLSDLLVMKFDSEGEVIWTRLLGRAGKLTGGSGNVSTDSSVYITGLTNGEIGSQSLNGYMDLFVVKYNSSGTLQWVRLQGAVSSITFGIDLGIDWNENIYVCGNTNGSFGGQTVQGNDLLISKFNKDGDNLWVRLTGKSSAVTTGRAIAVERSGNSYITGHTDGDIDGQLRSGTQDIFLIKYNSDGDKIWTKLAGAPGKNTFSWGIAADSAGHIYTAGQTKGDFNGNQLTGISDLSTVKYSYSGSLLWAKTIGYAGVSIEGRTLAVYGADVLYVAGYTDGDMGVLKKLGTKDLFITSELKP